MAQRDVVLRWIAQFGRGIARLVRRGTAGDLDFARQEIRRATGELLGPLASLLPQLEAASAAEVLGDPGRLLGWARLLDLEAFVSGTMGEAERASALRAQAVLLVEATRMRFPSAESECRMWLEQRDTPDDETMEDD